MKSFLKNIISTIIGIVSSIILLVIVCIGVIAIISSKPNIKRGDHYHKKTTQWMYITKGSLEYWYKPLKSKAKPKMKLLKVGDLIKTPPNEMHALKIGSKGNEFIVFTIGKRGGKDYENDTFRFTPSLIK